MAPGNFCDKLSQGCHGRLLGRPHRGAGALACAPTRQFCDKLSQKVRLCVDLDHAPHVPDVARGKALDSRKG